MERIYKIEDLKIFSELLDGQIAKPEFELTQNIPIYYIADNNYILYDSSVPYFHKVPELSKERFLGQMELLEAIHNKYIPIFDKSTKELLFSEEQFLELRKKMAGLKEYNSGEYMFSENLYFPGIEKYLELIDQNFSEIERQRNAIYKTISTIISKLGLKLSKEDIELIDTGSTSRGTNIPTQDANIKWDFDFLMKIDPEKREMVKTALLKELDSSIDRLISRFRIRLKEVKIEGLENEVDIDVSFVPKKEQYFSTEQALEERLEVLKKQDEEKYRLVLANIMHAKKILKSFKAYKPSRSDKSQGGLGGVGIENWILQHGGSFEDAAIEFLSNAQGKDFIEFEKEFAIYDFGKNHISVAKGIFPYDNFVMKNMREHGYLQMQQALLYFLNSLKKSNVTEKTKTMK